MSIRKVFVIKDIHGNVNRNIDLEELLHENGRKSQKVYLENIMSDIDKKGHYVSKSSAIYLVVIYIEYTLI